MFLVFAGQAGYVDYRFLLKTEVRRDEIVVADCGDRAETRQARYGDVSGVFWLWVLFGAGCR